MVKLLDLVVRVGALVHFGAFWTMPAFDVRVGEVFGVAPAVVGAMEEWAPDRFVRQLRVTRNDLKQLKPNETKPTYFSRMYTGTHLGGQTTLPNQRTSPCLIPIRMVLQLIVIVALFAGQPFLAVELFAKLVDVG
jgi:hypothetical protein